MKRIILFGLVMFFPIFVLANEYESFDINLKLDVKDDFIVLTRDNLEENANLEKIGLTENQIADIMDKGNIYFDIVRDDISYEILVVVPDVSLPINNLTSVNDEVLSSFKEEAAKKVGASNSSVYNGNYDYIVVDYYDNVMDYYVLNYYTVIDYKGYNIQMQKKSAITEDEKNDLKEIVDSIEYTILGDEEEVPKDTDDYKKSFDYKIIIYGALIGALAGLITYFIGINVIKKKSSK